MAFRQASGVQVVHHQLRKVIQTSPFQIDMERAGLLSPPVDFASGQRDAVAEDPSPSGVPGVDDNDPGGYEVFDIAGGQVRTTGPAYCGDLRIELGDGAAFRFAAGYQVTVGVGGSEVRKSCWVVRRSSGPVRCPR